MKPLRKDELRKVVVLEIGSNRSEAAAIYSCRELQDEVRYAGRIAMIPLTFVKLWI